jgi:site-specific DNA recombinase
MPNAETVALYMRVSSEEQRDRETIELQREFLKNYCQLYGFEIAEIYADDGVSGTIPLHERVEGKRLLEDAKAGKFDTVLVYKLDRLGRSLLVTVDAHDRLQAAGVALRSATEPIDTSTEIQGQAPQVRHVLASHEHRRSRPPEGLLGRTHGKHPERARGA